MDEEIKEKKGRRKRKLIVDEKAHLISAHRQLRKVRDSYYISIPREFVEWHRLKEGDVLPIVGNHILKIIPMKEEETERDVKES